MGKQAVTIVLSAQEKQQLRDMARPRRGEHQIVFRSKIILKAAEGTNNEEIAQALGTRRATVSQWRRRFADRRLDGLKDLPRPGAKTVYDDETEKRILALLDKSPPAGFGAWSGTLLSEALGDVSDDQVWRVLRKNHIHLRPSKSWCVSNDPAFAAKAAVIVGLYLNPPAGAFGYIL